MRYTNLGDEVTVGATIVQATVALDVAAKFAQETKNFDGMIQVAETWMKLADFMAALEDAEEKKGPKKKEHNVPLGFQPSDKDDDNEIEDDNARRDED